MGGRPLGDACKVNKYELFEDTSNFSRDWTTGESFPRGAALLGNKSPLELFGDPAKHSGVTQFGWCNAPADDSGGEPATYCPCHHDGEGGRAALPPSTRFAFPPSSLPPF